VFCPMAPSSVAFEHVSRSNHETICFSSEKTTVKLMSASTAVSHYVPSRVNPRGELSPGGYHKILALAEVCALWVLYSWRRTGEDLYPDTEKAACQAELNNSKVGQTSMASLSERSPGH